MKKPGLPGRLPSAAADAVPCGQVGGPDFISKLGGVMRLRRCKKGETIASEGDPSDFFGVVVSGRVSIIKHGPEGREIALRVLEKGQVFGLVAVLDGQPYPASVIAVEDGAVGILDKDQFVARLRVNPDAMLALAKGFGNQLRRFTSVICETATAGVESRLACRLLDMADGASSVAVTRKVLADLAGTTVETAIRVTKAWERSGMVKLSRGRIEIRDHEGLSALTCAS